MPQENHDRRTLSTDVKYLGMLLGEVIREQHGPEAFNLVERVRQIAKDRRAGDPQAAEQLIQLLNDITLQDKRVLVKAFGNYFQLINIAEDQERVRVLRQREQDGRLLESIGEAIADLKEQEVSAAEMHAILRQIRLRLVLTAHPSEAKRKEVLVKLREITNMMDRRERLELLPREEALLREQLSEKIEELWQTRPIRATQKSVGDEVDMGKYFITETIMPVGVALYDELQDHLEQAYPEGDWHELPAILRYASWIGGDRDGNPNVTTDITLSTLANLHDKARRVYLDDVERLRDHLTQDADEIDASPELMAAVADHPTFPGEPYRQQADRIWRRLNDDGYRDGADLVADLQIIADSLMQHRGQRVAGGLVAHLLRKIKLFGMHLVPLEVREDARLHLHTLDELFRHYGITSHYADMPEEARQALLTREIPNPRPLFPPRLDNFSETTQRVIQTWQMIGEAQARYGPRAIDTVIASMSRYPSDVLTMLLFATEVGTEEHLQIVPLFETIQDLLDAPDVMTTLFQNAEYKSYLERFAARHESGLRQQVMIGYSDSSKDGGYIASNWYLYTAQQRLTTTCERFGISLELFHGRGGSIGRGGGPTNRALLSHPPRSLRGGIKITEQGEVIAYRYSNTAIARRHLHQVFNALLIALHDNHQDDLPTNWRETMDKLSQYGRRAYRDFVYETDGFLEYWQQSTPINELSLLNISSRPAKRGSQGGFAAMRAIPWVFSWMQSRAIIPSWFGVGTALQQFAQNSTEGIALLQTMYQDWTFFRALIDNTELDVAKADMGIAALYATLVENDTLRETMLQRIQDEHALTVRLICEVTRQGQLLERMGAIRTSIERRNPYVDPLNFIQVDLLKRLRTMSPDDPEYQATLAGVLATVNGIAAGMKTTG